MASRAAHSLQSARIGRNWDLHRAFLLVSYGLVLAGFVPIAASGEVGVAAPLGFVAAMLWSLRRDPRLDPPSERTAQIWTAGLGTALVGLAVWAWQDGNWLMHAMQFALLLTMSRFYLRRFAKDHLQLYALSFLLLLVGAILSPGPVFALCFLAYTIGIMWGLAILHLVRELEVQTQTGPEHLLPPEPPKRRWLGLRAPLPLPPKVEWPELAVAASALDWRTRRLVGPQWFFATSALSMGVLLASALFFFLFPRLGVGFFFPQTRGNKSVIGFSTDAELGNFGALKTNPEVVMRVQFPGQPDKAKEAVRLRGVTFDTFGGKSWTRQKEYQRPLQWDGQRLRVPTVQPPRDGLDKTWLADIYLEPLSMDERVLFTPPRALSVQILDADFDYLRGQRRRVLAGTSGDLTFRAPGESALHYQVEVVEPVSDAEEVGRLRDQPADYPRQLAERYTKLPSGLDPRIAALAEQLVGKETTPFRKATRLAEALQAGWTYSLAGDQDDAKPLEDFLFGKKSGHCEYFATAMAVLLRTQGVAARTVHGFVGGEYNDYGGYRMIRQGDAHSWVEVWFADYGWRTFDPTPPSGQLAPESAGLLATMRQLVDNMELAWYQWIVEYDLERQVELVRGIAAALRNLSAQTGLKMGGTRSEVVQDEAPAQRSAPWSAAQKLAVAAAVLAAAGAALWWWRRSRRGAGPQVFDAQLESACQRLQKRLSRLGWERQGSETWTGHAKRMAAVDAELSRRLHAFATAFDTARYDPRAGPEMLQAAVQSADAVAVWVAAQPVQKAPRSPSALPSAA